MSSRTGSHSPAGGVAGFWRIIGRSQHGAEVFSAGQGGIANQAFAGYIEVPVDCTVASLGVYAGEKVDGNVMLGVYDSSFNRLCVTNATAVAGLTVNAFNWIVPTTLPALTAGIHWLAASCDTAYVSTVSGIRYGRNLLWDTDAVDTVNLGQWGLVTMNAAYPLPDPFVPINSINNQQFGVVMRVTM